MLLWHVWWDSVDLLGIENGVDAVDQTGLRRVARALLTVSVLFDFVRRRSDIPVFDLRTLFSAADLPSLVRCLLVRHPPRILVAAFEARRHQMQRVTTPICAFARWIERHI